MIIIIKPKDFFPGDGKSALRAALFSKRFRDGEGYNSIIVELIFANATLHEFWLKFPSFL